jgi:hypothetical protein
LGKYSAVARIAAGKLPASPMARIVRATMKPMTDAGTARPSSDFMPLPSSIE